MQFLYNFDIFAASPSWNIVGSLKTGSSCGFFFTFSSIALFIAASVYLSQDMIHKTNPIIVQSSLDGILFDQTIHVSSNNYKFAFGLQDTADENFFWDSSYFFIDARVYDSYGNATALIPSVCDWINDQYPAIGPRLSFNQDELLKIDKFNGYISIKLKFCNNATAACKTKEEIDAKLKRTNFVWYYAIAGVNPSNYDSPLTSIVNWDTYQVLSNMGKFFIVYVGMNEVQTDSGLIFSDIKTVSNLGTQNQWIDAGTPDIAEGVFLRVELWNGGRKYLTQRRYSKIQDILAQVVSMINVFILFFGMVVAPYARINMYEKISQKILSNFNLHNVEKSFKSFKKPELHNVNNGKSIKTEKADQPPDSPERTNNQIMADSEFKVVDMTDNNISNVSISQLKLNQLMTIEEEGSSNKNFKPPWSPEGQENEKDDAKKKKNLRVSLCEWLRSICCKVPKVVVIDKLGSEVNKYMDISLMVSKMWEIDMLKQLLLNHDQRLVFESMLKPKLIITEVEKEFKNKKKKELQPKLDIENRFDQDNDNDLQKAYLKLSRSDNISVIDRKLLKTFEEYYKE